MFWTGRSEDAERELGEAIAALKALGETIGAGEAMLSLVVALSFRGETGRARSLLQNAVELLEHETPGPALARAYAATAREHMVAASFPECLDWSEKAIALADEFGVHGLTVRARQFRGAARFGLGDLGAIDDLRESLRLGLELGLGAETALAYENLAAMTWWIEGPEAALELSGAGIGFAERRGLVQPAVWCKGERTWLLFDLGSWDDLIRLADEVLDWDRVHGGSQAAIMALSFKARVLLLRGDMPSAARLAKDFLPRARQSGDPQVLGPALAIAAVLEHATGEIDAALRLVEEFDARIDLRAKSRIQELPEVVRVCAAAGAITQATALLAVPQHPAARSRHSLVTARAVVAEASCELEQAAALYAEADRSWADFGFKLERGQALLGLARCRVSLGQRKEATAALVKASNIFTALGAQPLIADVDELLSEATASTA